MNRHSSLDFIKFFMAIVIVVYHYGIIFWGGYLVVECFFMISGFLMMNSVYRAKARGDERADSTFRFVLHKYKAIFLPLLFAALMSFVFYTGIAYKMTFAEAMRKLPYLVFEIFPLQVAGFTAYYVTGVSWYLAAMLLSMAILHPIAKRNPDSFCYTVAPLVAIFCYGWLCINFQQLDRGSAWIMGIINSGMLRGLAGISAGCLLYALTQRREGTAVRQSMLSRSLYTVAELALWVSISYTILTKELSHTTMDFVVVAAFFAALYIALGQKSLFALFINRKWSGVLSTCSTYMFINHSAWNRCIKKFFPDCEPLEVMHWYFLGVAGCCLLTFGLTKLTEYLIRRVKARSAPV